MTGVVTLPDEDVVISSPVHVFFHDDFYMDRKNHRLLAMRNDLAVIKLTQPIVLNERVNVINISNETYQPEDVFVVTTLSQNNLLFKLMYVHQVSVHPTDCGVSFFNHSSEICTTGINSPCDGDSGSGLIKKGSLIATLSYGINCDMSDEYELRDIYSDVTKRVPWIQSIITLD